MTPAGTSNELDVQNEWEENTHTHTAVRFVWRIASLLGVCGLVNYLHLPFGCFPSIPLLRRRDVLIRQEHGLTILLGNSFGERGARTSTSSLVLLGADVWSGFFRFLRWHICTTARPATPCDALLVGFLLCSRSESTPAEQKLQPQIF